MTGEINTYDIWYDIRLTIFNIPVVKFVSIPLGAARRPALLKLIADWEKSSLTPFWKNPRMKIICPP